ncbi:MAG: bifunctional diguanylate cyclase/phosphodiesterase [Xanthobacteraceae bacterium]
MKLHILNIPSLALQRRGSAILGLIIVGIIWAGVALLFRHDRHQDYLSVIRRNENYASLFDDNVLRTLGEIDKTILYLRGRVEALKDTTDYQKIVQSSDLRSETIVQVAIIDAKGIARATSALKKLVTPIDVSDREHFKVQVHNTKDTLFISKPVVGRASGKWSVQLTRRFLNKDGSFAGVVVASMDPAHFTSFFDQIKLGADTSVALIGTDGVVRSEGGGAIPQVALGQNLSGTELFKRLQKVEDGTFVERAWGPRESLIVSARQVHGYPLWVTVSTEDRQIYQSAWSHLWRNVLIATILTGLMLLALEKILRAEARAEQKAKQLQLTLEHIGQGIMLVTKDREIPIINQRCAELLLLPEGMVDASPKLDELIKCKIGDDVSQMWSGSSPAADNGGIHSADAQMSSITSLQRSDGAYIEVRKAWLPDGAFVQTFTDITKRRQAEAHIIKLASEDPLTSLVNRRVFRARMQDLCESCSQTKFVVLFLDMDRFKVVNDTLGHRTGDQLLIQVAKRLRSVLKEADVLARLGGDEFAILLSAIQSIGEVEAVAQRIIDAFAESFKVDQNVITIGTSIGIAIGPDHGSTADALLVAADLALYSVKVGSRGTYRIFERRMNDEVNMRREIELELKEALTSGGLDVHYQPIVDLQNYSITGFEALMRWPHPSKGMLSPAKFIPVAEECGLIDALGHWILLKACRQAREWPPTMKLSVNVSPIQLAKPDIVATVESVLATTGLEAHRLVLECTETIFIEDSEKMLSTLHKLKQIGVQIALDDFGTGYSSLSYLRRFPFDTVKIDRSFVSDLSTSTSSSVIVQAVILIAASLGIKTVAEGVEAEEQLQFLKLLGCNEVQGYLLGMPAPAGEIGNLVTQRSVKAAAA